MCVCVCEWVFHSVLMNVSITHLPYVFKCTSDLLNHYPHPRLHSLTHHTPSPILHTPPKQLSTDKNNWSLLRLTLRTFLSGLEQNFYEFLPQVLFGYLLFLFKLSWLSSVSHFSQCRLLRHLKPLCFLCPLLNQYFAKSNTRRWHRFFYRCPTSFDILKSFSLFSLGNFLFLHFDNFCLYS